MNSDIAKKVVAGPCSAESRGQVMRVARDLHELGIHDFRAGVWKPRTMPGGFEGVGAPALEWLKEVKRTFGMRVFTEVALPEHLKLVMDADLDGIWLGARTVTNPFAVQAVADTLRQYPRSRLDSLTVMVKNPMNPDVDLWRGAIERITEAGITNLIAVHRGFSAYGERTFRNAPIWRIPIELHRRLPDIPLLCDPSHIAGRRDLVEKICREASLMNFNGLIVECHCDPDSALSDAAQQITPSRLAEILAGIATSSGSGDEDPRLADLRRDIDRLDTEMLEILARRMKVSQAIGDFKRVQGMPVVQPERYKILMERLVEEGARLGLQPQFLRLLLATIHEESVRQQIDTH